MLKVGLTGGIACGKTLVRMEMQRLGAFTLDSDELARKAVKTGQPAHRHIVEVFGDGVLTSDGEIDRRRLGDMVFADERLRLQLNQIVHPHILRLQEEWLADLAGRGESGPAIVDAALMIETGSYRRYDVLVVAYCKPSIQLLRLMRRDNLTRHQAQSRIDTQMPVSCKVRHADFVVDNSGRCDFSLDQARQVLRKIRA